MLLVLIGFDKPALGPEVVEIVGLGAAEPVFGIAVRGDGEEVYEGVGGDDNAAGVEGEWLGCFCAFGDGDDRRD